jgi:hypothetical protein
MKNKAKILLLVGLLSSTAFAEPQKDIYFGVGVNKATFEIVEPTYTMEYDEKSYKLLAGKRIDNEISAELQYLDFSKQDLLVDSATIPVIFSGNSIGLSGLYYLDPQKEFSPFAKLGIHSWDIKESFEELDLTMKGNGIDVFYGAGVDGKIDKYDDIKYRLEFERLEFDGVDFDTLSAGLLFDY